jgi:hypothetical protein
MVKKSLSKFHPRAQLIAFLAYIERRIVCELEEKPREMASGYMEKDQIDTSIFGLFPQNPIPVRM